MKYLLFPLIVMMFVSVMYFYGIGNAVSPESVHYFDDRGVLGIDDASGYVDATGRVVADSNHTVTTNDPNWVTVEWNTVPLLPIAKNVTHSPYLYDTWWTAREYVGEDRWHYVNSTGDYPTTPVDPTHPVLRTFVLSGSGQVVGVFSALGLIALAIGIRVLGTGTNSFSVGFFVMSVGLAGLWTIVSWYAYGMFQMLPLGIGIFLYFGLSLMFSVGVFDAVGGAGKGD